LTTPARRIADAARGLGLHPFHIPIAINHAGTREPRCINCFTCDGFPCRIGAKNDVTQTALAKADPNNLAVVARTVAARLVERDGRIEGVEAIDRDGGRRLTLRARVCVLSGGAIGSPALMLRSGLGARDASGSQDDGRGTGLRVVTLFDERASRLETSACAPRTLRSLDPA